MKKIFITGGHFAPAKAVIQELLRRGEWEVYYLGRKYSMEGEQALALEYTEIPQLSGVKYLIITTGRIQRQFLVNIVQSVGSFLKIFVGFGQSFWWLLKYRPGVILSFGGYVAVPIVVLAWLFRVPIFTQEQTVVSGRSNQFISRLARKVFISWPQSLANFPRDKVVLTGLPLREEIILAASRQQVADSKKKPLIYVTGGNQGSHALNEAVAEILPELLTRYRVIHQTGGSGRFADFEKLSKINNPNYQVLRQLEGDQSAQIEAAAALFVARAGANTCAEILALGKMAILIPLPNTFAHEQEKNGQMVATSGLGEVILQADLRPKLLLQKVGEMMANPKKYLSGAGEARKLIHFEAAAKIVDELEKYNENSI